MRFALPRRREPDHKPAALVSSGLSPWAGSMKIAATPKEKLFETAARLFYQYGYRAVGVDAIAADPASVK